ncbi:MAG: aminotransferase class I/II-fold pyridoxal phosphate-dependent enzyme [Desulfobulbaceae bacterium]|uniref:Aminotransferase class I/II-fold pyridoxal phosphate-dependent enzyme n=1 Tax=Candidatus Desulfobia pelagia TaxID=2841692 RepID=A0A8J6NBD3_9BACT|nr:aminotransferase class I/II-fold pyridoxal phosphate-dependent enzyme [Candidatus Desulfobia pelagia]
MATEKLEKIITASLAALAQKGTLKGSEKIICGMKPAGNGFGERYFLEGYGGKQFLRMNSNSYLGLSTNRRVIEAEDAAAKTFGTGPGAVRFISGTYLPHVELEKKLAAFHGREAAMIFSAAYAAVMGVLPALISDETIVVSDALNHNSIINAIRLARPAGKLVYRHLDMEDFEEKLQSTVGKGKRVIVVTDGIFSMRGDHVPLQTLSPICQRYENKFPEGIITVVDDSHGVGAFGHTGRGTEEYAGARADILIATLGKALGVNGGYVAASAKLIGFLRETAPFYIYSNSITPSEAAAAIQSLEILDSIEGKSLLKAMRRLVKRLEEGLISLGYEVIESEHPIVPLLLRDTEKTGKLVEYLFEHAVLATGLKFPVVPKGDEEIRFQVSAGHTEKDIDSVLDVLREF